MRDATRWTLALALTSTFGALACTSDELVFIPLPDTPSDITWVAVLVADSGGTLLTSTGLQPWSRDRPIRLEKLKVPESSVLDLVGWSDATLERLRAPSAAERLATSAIVDATGCDPVLPAAGWAARFDHTGAALPLAPAARRLTTEWLSSSCPDVSGSVAVDVRCMVTACPGFTKQEGCTLTVDLDNCTEGVHRAHVDWQGHLCGIESDKPGCSFVAPNTPALATIDCSGADTCTIDLYSPPEAPAFTVDTVPVLRGVAARTPKDVAELGVRGWAPFTGYVSGLTVQSGRVTVSTFDGRFHDAARCVDPLPTRTYFLDPDTLEEQSSAVTPPCLRNLLAVPGASGFFGVSGSTKARSLVELDEDGRVLRTHPLELPDLEHRQYDDVALRLALDGGRLLVLLRWYIPSALAEEEHGSILIEVARGTFAQNLLYASPTGIPWGLTEAEGGALVIADEDDDSITVIDGVDGRPSQRPISLFHVSSVSAGHLAWFQPTRELLVPIAFAEEVMHLVSLTNLTDFYVAYYERSAGPMITSPWPPDPELVATGAAYSGRGDARDAWLSLFEPRKRRFLPGATRLGYGIPGQMLTDGGRVWVTLPWDGSLARVTPR